MREGSSSLTCQIDTVMGDASAAELFDVQYTIDKPRPVTSDAESKGTKSCASIPCDARPAGGTYSSGSKTNLRRVHPDVREPDVEQFPDPEPSVEQAMHQRTLQGSPAYLHELLDLVLGENRDLSRLAVDVDPLDERWVLVGGWPSTSRGPGWSQRLHAYGADHPVLVLLER